MNSIYIPRPFLDDLRAHGEETYPIECCGALLGQNIEGEWRIVRTVRTRNTCAESARTRYTIDAAELVRIQRDGLGQGLEIAGFYHSHPDHSALWSLTDLAEAHWLGCAYIITAVVNGRAGATNSFLLAGSSEESKRFVPQQIVVRDER